MPIKHSTMLSTRRSTVVCVDVGSEGSAVMHPRLLQATFSQGGRRDTFKETAALSLSASGVLGTEAAIHA